MAEVRDIVFALLGMVEFLLRVVLVLVAICSVVGAFALVLMDDPFAELLDPILWRKIK